MIKYDDLKRNVEDLTFHHIHKCISAYIIMITNNSLSFIQRTIRVYFVLKHEFKYNYIMQIQC